VACIVLASVLIYYGMRKELKFNLKFFVTVGFICAFIIMIVSCCAWAIETMVVFNISHLALKKEGVILYRMSEGLSASVSVGSTAYAVSGDVLVFEILNAVQAAIQLKRHHIGVRSAAVFSVFVTLSLGVLSFYCMSDSDLLTLGLWAFGIGYIVSGTISFLLCCYLVTVGLLPFRVKLPIYYLMSAKLMDVAAGLLFTFGTQDKVFCIVDDISYVRAPKGNIFHSVAMVFVTFSGIMSTVTIVTLYVMKVPPVATVPRFV